MYRSFFKRVFDIVAATLALLLSAVPMAIIAVLIRARMGRPVVYASLRPGRYGRPFVLYKFRTMVEAFNESGEALPDRDRVTPLGRLLRRTSLDELPQLINVLRGDMSLVGPRPLLMRYLALYTPFEARRHEVRPGITGIAQIRGRNRVRWDERFRLDVEYVDHVSFLLDVRILLQTIVQIALRESVSRDGDVDVPLFTRNADPRP